MSIALESVLSNYINSLAVSTKLRIEQSFTGPSLGGQDSGYGHIAYILPFT